MRDGPEKVDVQLKVMIRLDGDVSPISIAQYYAYRGDADQAFACMDRALKFRDPG